MWKNIERSSKRTQGHTCASQLSFSTVLTGNLSTLEDIQHIIWDHDIYHQFWSFLLHSSYWFQFLKEKKKKKMSRSLKLIKWNKILLLRQTATMMGKWGSSLCLPFGCLLLLETSWELKPGLWCLGESRSGCSSLSDFIASHGWMLFALEASHSSSLKVRRTAVLEELSVIKTNAEPQSTNLKTQLI